MLKSIRSVHANLMWNPVERVTVDLEFMTGRRDNAGVATVAEGPHKSGQATRVQMGIRYDS